MPEYSAGTGSFTPASSRKSAPFLRAATVFSGGSEKVRAVTRSRGLRNTSMVGPNCVTVPSDKVAVLPPSSSASCGSVVA
jgi:hypothetical protein